MSKNFDFGDDIMGVVHMLRRVFGVHSNAAAIVRAIALAEACVEQRSPANVLTLLSRDGKQMRIMLDK